MSSNDDFDLDDILLTRRTEDGGKETIVPGKGEKKKEIEESASAPEVSSPESAAEEAGTGSQPAEKAVPEIKILEKSAQSDETADSKPAEKAVPEIKILEKPAQSDEAAGSKPAEKAVPEIKIPEKSAQSDEAAGSKPAEKAVPKINVAESAEKSRMKPEKAAASPKPAKDSIAELMKDKEILPKVPSSAANFQPLPAPASASGKKAKPPKKKADGLKNNSEKSGNPMRMPEMKKQNYGRGCFVFALCVILLIGGGVWCFRRFKPQILDFKEKFEQWMIDHKLAHDGGDAPWKHDPNRKPGGPIQSAKERKEQVEAQSNDTAAEADQ